MSGCLGGIIGMLVRPIKFILVDAPLGLLKFMLVDAPKALLTGFFQGMTRDIKAHSRSSGNISRRKKRRSSSSDRGLFGSTYQERYRQARRRGHDPADARRLAKSGCYVATAVYGSYDCPEVWTLRRYRDRCLAATWYGHLFIRVYYAVSPTLVRWFGSTAWFQRIGRAKLDGLVARLQCEGFASTPYRDRAW